MAQASTHRIRSQRWRVEPGSAAGAFAWRALLREEGEALVRPLLERAFDEAAPGDAVLHVSRLKLRVRLPAGAGPQDLPAFLQTQLPEQLEHLLPGLGP